MKTLLLASLLLPCLSAVAQLPDTTKATQRPPAGSISALDARNGFRTYVLGAPLRDYPQLKRKGADMYVSPQEPLLEADARLTSLNFTSYKGRLASINFGAMGTDNIEKLLKRFAAEYGPSTVTNAVLQSWVGSKATLYVTRVGAGEQEIGIIMLKSNELAAAQKAAGK